MHDSAGLPGVKSALVAFAEALGGAGLIDVVLDRSPSVIRSLSSDFVVAYYELDVGSAFVTTRLPEMNAHAIKTGEETTLTHRNGLGLWVVWLLILQTGGDVSVDTSDTATHIRLHTFEQTKHGCLQRARMYWFAAHSFEANSRLKRRTTVNSPPSLRR